MKKTYLIILILISQLSIAQITLQHTFTGNGSVNALQYFHLSDGSINYYLYDPNSEIMTVYAEDYSLKKTIDLSAFTASGYRINDIAGNNGDRNNTFLVSDQLFNTDSKLELIFSVSNTSYPQTSVVYKIVNEDATELFSKTCEVGSSSNITSAEVKVYKDGAGQCQMELPTKQDWIDAPVGQQDYYETKTEIYSLPGSLPITGLLQFNEVSNIASVYPNPAKDYIKLEYEMPEALDEMELRIFDVKGNMIKSVTVDGVVDFVLLEIDALENGTYILNSFDKKKLLDSSKFIVMK